MTDLTTEHLNLSADQIAAEQKRGKLAGAAGIGSAAALIAAGVVGSSAAEPGTRDNASKWLLAFNDHQTAQIVSGGLLALSILLLGGLLLHLARAAQVRDERLPLTALGIALVGPVLMAIWYVAMPIALSIEASQYADGTARSVAAVKDRLKDPQFLVLAGVGLAALLSIASAFLVINRAAMRVGLLTRFHGTLGMIVGGLILVQSLLSSLLNAGLGPATLVQLFWLAVVSVTLVLGGHRLPPAWHTGAAEPWPNLKQHQHEHEHGDDCNHDEVPVLQDKA